MRNSKRTLDGQVAVDEMEFTWRLHREPQWCTVDGWRGMVIAVTRTDGQREALIEWPMPERGKSRSVQYRQRPKVDTLTLTTGIRTAIEAGWDPSSRGKPVQVLLK